MRSKTISRLAECLLLAMVLVATGCASGSGSFRKGYDFTQARRVAVVKVTGVYGEGAQNQLADFMTMELLEKGYAPVERSQIQEILKEQEFQRGDVTSPENVAQMGKILNVDAVVVLNVPQFEEEISMTAKMIDVEDGTILWTGQGTGSTGETLSTVGGALVGATAGVLVGGDRTGQVVGGVAGGVAGGLAGQALSPQKAKAAQKVIARACETLPPSY